MTVRNLRDEIGRLLAERWPEHVICLERCPQDIQRPGFLIQTPAASQKSASFFALAVTVKFTITCLAQLDEGGEADRTELEALQDGVLELFRAGFLRVGDRAPKCEASAGGIDPDKALVDVQCSYWEERDLGAAQPAAMGEISVNIKKEE